jgi:hypothetical protein
MVHLKDLTALKYLSLEKTLVDSKGIEALRRLTKLENLILTGTGLTDVGLDTISNFKELQYLMLGDTVVSVEGIERIQEKLPNCHVIPPRNLSRQLLERRRGQP